MKKIFTLCLLIVLSMIVLTACKQEHHKTLIETDDTALLTLYTFDGSSESTMGLFNLGHAFVSIENISENTITIGKNSLEPHQAITIGTWSIKAHFGVWYNVESNYIKNHNKYDGRLSVTCGIDSNDIVTISKFIDNNDYWSPLHNCSQFALNLWNSVANTDEELVTPVIYSPSKIAKSLKTFDVYQTNRPIETGDKMYYFDGDTPQYFELEK